MFKSGCGESRKVIFLEIYLSDLNSVFLHIKPGLSFVSLVKSTTEFSWYKIYQSTVYPIRVVFTLLEVEEGRGTGVCCIKFTE